MTPAAATTRERLRPLHEPPLRFGGHFLAGGAHLALAAASIAAWTAGYWPLSVLLWPALAWMGHAALSRLHEAAHRMLFRSRVLNEAVGVLIGTLALTPLSVYRYVHNQHHAHLGRRDDPEFRPYNLPEAPRWKRLAYAWLELLAGWVFTPALYSLRTARAWPSLSPGLRRRLVFEWALLFAAWAAILLLVHRTGTWGWLLAGHLGPAWIAGSAQTVRKFTEHLGRFGETIPEMTRTVVYERPIGRAASRSQLHVEHHGTHHRWPGIPFHNLPEATPVVYEEQRARLLYPNHWAAVRDMLPNLLDPRVGPQWLDGRSAGATNA